MTFHVHRRMEDRGFNEVDLRTMLEIPVAILPQIPGARWQVYSRFRGQFWKIVVEPDPGARIVLVITAYPLENGP